MSLLLGGFDSGASTLMFEKDISNLAKPQIKGRGFLSSGNDIIETQTFYTKPETDWVFDESLKMTYDNPIFIEQKKRRKETVDDSGFVRQFKLDENDDGQVIVFEADDDDDDIEDDDFEEDDEDFEDNEIIFDNPEPENDFKEPVSFKLNGVNIPVRERMEAELQDKEIKPTPKLNLKIKPMEEKPVIKFNIKK